MRTLLITALLTLGACGGTEATPAAGSAADALSTDAAATEAPADEAAAPTPADDAVADAEEPAADEGAAEEGAEEPAADDAVADEGAAEPAADEPAPAAGGPADMVWDHPMGKVTFSHASHTTRESNCATCHPALFAMKAKTATLKMDAMYAGETCGTCHKTGGKAFDAHECAKCHIK